MAIEDEESPPRQEFEFSLRTTERGQIRFRLLDRINVDDVFLHLVDRELFRLRTGEDPGIDVDQRFKDFLLKERFTAGQN